MRALISAATLLLVTACSSRDQAPSPKPEAPSPKPEAPAPTPRGPAEVFFGGDPQSAPVTDLAVGGGWLYWVERPLRDTTATNRVLRRKSTTDPAASPETLTIPDSIWAIAADEDAVYVSGMSVWSRPHSGPWVLGLSAGRTELVPDAAHEIVPGHRYLLLDAFDHIVLVPKRAGSTAEAETVWQGKYVANTLGGGEGDRFFVHFEPESYRRTGPMMMVGPGQPLGIFVEAPQLSLRPRTIVENAGFLYFTGPAPPTATSCPTWPGCERQWHLLWRLDARGGGDPEHVGQLNNVGKFAIRNGVFMGEVFDGQAKVVRLSLDHPAERIVVDELAHTELRKTAWPVHTIVADDRHAYYVTTGSNVIRRAAW